MDTNEILKTIVDKLEKFNEEMTDIKVILAKQEESLRLHIYRTDLAEKNIELLRNQVKPIEDHVKYINGGLKLIGVISLVAGALISVLELFKLI